VSGCLIEEPVTRRPLRGRKRDRVVAGRSHYTRVQECSTPHSTRAPGDLRVILGTAVPGDNPEQPRDVPDPSASVGLGLGRRLSADLAAVLGAQPEQEAAEEGER